MPRFKRIVYLKLFNQKDGEPGGIKLTQEGVDNFSVTSGLQTKAKLSYSQAAEELGECIMFHLACEGQLDNREKGDNG